MGSEEKSEEVEQRVNWGKLFKAGKNALKKHGKKWGKKALKEVGKYGAKKLAELAAKQVVGSEENSEEVEQRVDWGKLFKKGKDILKKKGKKLLKKAGKYGIKKAKKFAEDKLPALLDKIQNKLESQESGEAQAESGEEVEQRLNLGKLFKTGKKILKERYPNIYEKIVQKMREAAKKVIAETEA